MWIIVSVTIRLSSQSLKKQAGRQAGEPSKASAVKLGSTHGAPSSKLHHWDRESSMFRLKVKEKIAGDIHWLFLK